MPWGFIILMSSGCDRIWRLKYSVPFEILNLPFVFFGRLHGFECAEVAVFLCLRVGFTGIKPVFTGF
jgi:hypothetical protein